MKIICGLAAIAMLASAQEPAAKIDRKLIQLKYVDASRVRNLAGVFAGGRDWSVESDDRLHWIAVRGPADIVASFEEAVKKLDVPPASFELTVFLISTSGQGGDQLPEALASTAKQLHSVFAYKGYQLIESFVLRGRDGNQNGSADGTLKNSTYSFHYNRASVLDGTPKMISLQNVNLQIRMPTGAMDEKGNARYKTTGVSTDVDIRDGQKVVVGKSDMNSGDSPLILVVTAKVVE